jgi:hypothetical protein
MATREMCDLLEQAIKTGKKSRPFKPTEVFSEQVVGAVRTYLETVSGWVSSPQPYQSVQYIKALRKCKRKGYLEIRKGKVFLKPIEPVTKNNWGGDYNCLVHKGLILGNGDNLVNLKTWGVFGDYQECAATYLMRPGAVSEIFGGQNWSMDNFVTLFIDRDELMKRRSVFLDPETISDDMFGEKPLDSYFVLGGIPREAITSFNASNGSGYVVSFRKRSKRDLGRRR